MPKHPPQPRERTPDGLGSGFLHCSRAPENASAAKINHARIRKVRPRVRLGPQPELARYRTYRGSTISRSPSNSTDDRDNAPPGVYTNGSTQPMAPGTRRLLESQTTAFSVR
jgi:hypothetical protein